MDDRAKTILEIHLREYDWLRSEITLHIQRYQHVSRFAQIMTMAILTGCAYASANIDTQPTDKNWVFWAFGSFVVFLVCNKNSSWGVDGVYAILVLAARLTMIEEKINHIAEYRAIDWESRLAGRFWKGMTSGSLINPFYISVICDALLYISGGVAIPIYCQIRILEQVNTGPAIASAIFMFIFSVGTAVITITNGWRIFNSREYILDKMRSMCS